MSRIILASKSPYRKALLNRLGIEFLGKNSGLDESGLKAKINDPIELTQELAKAKAKYLLENDESVSESDIIIGSDQVCHLEGEILGKTGSLEISEQQLTKMSGKTHELVTSYTILRNGVYITKTNITKLYMRNLTNNQIKKYLSVDNPIDCAGSYKLELNGISLFNKIETDDQSAIIGLPLICLSNELNKMGIQIPPAS